MCWIYFAQTVNVYHYESFISLKEVEFLDQLSDCQITEQDCSLDVDIRKLWQLVMYSEAFICLLYRVTYVCMCVYKKR